MALVAACELDHQPQVGVDQTLLGVEVAALDPLRELDLLLAGEQGVAARLVIEELEAVGGLETRSSAPRRGARSRGFGRRAGRAGPLTRCADLRRLAYGSLISLTRLSDPLLYKV